MHVVGARISFFVWFSVCAGGGLLSGEEKSSWDVVRAPLTRVLKEPGEKSSEFVRGLTGLVDTDGNVLPSRVEALPFYNESSEDKRFTDIQKHLLSGDWILAAGPFLKTGEQAEGEEKMAGAVRFIPVTDGGQLRESLEHLHNQFNLLITKKEKDLEFAVFKGAQSLFLTGEFEGPAFDQYVRDVSSEWMNFEEYFRIKDHQIDWNGEKPKLGEPRKIHPVNLELLKNLGKKTNGSYTKLNSEFAAVGLHEWMEVKGFVQLKDAETISADSRITPCDGELLEIVTRSIEKPDGGGGLVPLEVLTKALEVFEDGWRAQIIFFQHYQMETGVEYAVIPVWVLGGKAGSPSILGRRFILTNAGDGWIDQTEQLRHTALTGLLASSSVLLPPLPVPADQYFKLVEANQDDEKLNSHVIDCLRRAVGN